MRAKIRINPVATSDLQEIKDYISQNSIEAALKIVTNIVSKIEDLSEFPEMGTALMKKIKLKSNYRYLVCGQYLVFYIYENDFVSIQRILHGKRDVIKLLSDEKQN